MATLVARILVAVIALTQIPPVMEVFAQEADTQEVAETATSTDVVVEPEVVTTTAPWYKSEQIFGRVEVGDFVVGPGRAEVTARPGETVYTEITVTNRISNGREFFIEVEDIEGSQEGDSLVALGNEGRSPQGLVDYISFPETTLNLDLGERARLPVEINVPENASPGGYYGAVLISTVRQGETQEGLAPRSPIIARVASLVFLTIEGDVSEEGEVVSFDTINNFSNWGLWYEKGPIDFGILYENTGTIHLNPYGEISIKNILGEEVGYLQLEPWFVLPNALRLREFSWDREFLFGRYTVEAQINRGYREGEDVIDTVTTSFWVLPWRLVGGIFVGLFILIFLIRTFFRKFEFKRKS